MGYSSATQLVSSSPNFPEQQCGPATLCASHTARPTPANGLEKTPPSRGYTSKVWPQWVHTASAGHGATALPFSTQSCGQRAWLTDQSLLPAALHENHSSSANRPPRSFLDLTLLVLFRTSSHHHPEAFLASHHWPLWFFYLINKSASLSWAGLLQAEGIHDPQKFFLYVAFSLINSIYFWLYHLKKAPHLNLQLQDVYWLFPFKFKFES